MVSDLKSKSQSYNQIDNQFLEKLTSRRSEIIPLFKK